MTLIDEALSHMPLRYKRTIFVHTLAFSEGLSFLGMAARWNYFARSFRQRPKWDDCVVTATLAQPSGHSGFELRFAIADQLPTSHLSHGAIISALKPITTHRYPVRHLPTIARCLSEGTVYGNAAGPWPDMILTPEALSVPI